MRQTTFFVCLAALLSSTVCQLVSVKDGKISVNFGGYHAGVSLGGLLGGEGTAGGLYAEAGTPHGQNARAGLGGIVDAHGKTSGGLYAGATAGGNIRAETGLSGGIDAEKSAGNAFAAAQAGDRISSTRLTSGWNANENAGFRFFGDKSIGEGKKVMEKNEFVQPMEVVKPKINSFEKVNEVVPKAGENEGFETNLNVHKQPVISNFAAETNHNTGIIVEKHIHRFKPSHHVRKTASIRGHVGTTPAFYRISPPIQKRIDVESSVGVEPDVSGSGGITITKNTAWQRNPSFFADIFNIPIQTLKAVSNLVSNTAGTVQKSTSFQADTNLSSPKHQSVIATSDSQISLDTGKIIQDIFSIPINTLGAVNKFLENNVSPKSVENDHSRQRRFPGRKHSRKEVVFVTENESTSNQPA